MEEDEIIEEEDEEEVIEFAEPRAHDVQKGSSEPYSFESDEDLESYQSSDASSKKQSEE